MANLGNVIRKTDHNIRQRKKDGYIEATSLSIDCKKNFSSYKRTKRGQLYIQSVAKFLNTISNKLIDKTTKQNKGTWLHPYIALDFSLYLHPEISVNVYRCVDEYIKHDINFMKVFQKVVGDVKSHQNTKQNAHIQKAWVEFDKCARFM
jgi:hypothetical protein